MAAPHIVAEPEDPFVRLHDMVERLRADVQTGQADSSQSMIGKIDEDLREITAAARKVEDRQHQDPATQLAEAIGKAVGSSIASVVGGRGQPPIGRGGVYGIVFAVCGALLGSPVLESMLPANEELEAKRAAAAAITDQRLDDIETWQASVDRRLASEQRTNAWVGEGLRKSLKAIGTIAHKLDIEDVDTEMPVLWPE